MEIEQTKYKKKAPDVSGISLDECAAMLLDWVYGHDPIWRDRDEACAAEFGLSPLQRIGKYVGIVLDQGLHLNLLNGYDFVETASKGVGDVMTPMRGTCPACKQSFERKYPGQVCCSNECGVKHFPPPQQKQPEYDDTFERALELQNRENERLAKLANEAPAGRQPAIPVAGVLR